MPLRMFNNVLLPLTSHFPMDYGYHVKTAAENCQFFLSPLNIRTTRSYTRTKSHSRIKHHKKTKMLGFASNTLTGFSKDRCCREHATQVHPHSLTGRTLTHQDPRSPHAGPYAGLLLPPCAPISTVTHVNGDTVLSQSKRCAHKHWNHHMHWCKLHQNIPCVPSTPIHQHHAA